MDVLDALIERARNDLHSHAGELSDPLRPPTQPRERRRHRAIRVVVCCVIVTAIVMVATQGSLTAPRVSVDPAAPATIRQLWSGLEVTLPDGWSVAEESLTPHLTGPSEVLTASTAPMPSGGDVCAQFPENAIENLGPVDGLVTLQEILPDRTTATDPPRLGDVQRWPEAHANRTTAMQCVDNASQLDFYSFTVMSQDGTHYHVLAVFGLGAGGTVHSQALELLNSAHKS